ncbi:MAG: hypothetical protein RLZZ366_1787 [Pseudomonadota bacterium]|jgi:two-component system, OmpR family, response regulator
MRILLVEDDREIAERLVSRLKSSGFAAESAPDAETALDWQSLEQCGAIIIDLGLPGMDGIDLIQRYRSRGLKTPILILTARGSWQEKVNGLNAGADDYVVKPARAEELVARIHAMTRRASGQSTSKITVRNISLDPGAKSAWLDDEQLDLTQTEFKLLHLFLLKPGHFLGQQEILEQLYPSDKGRDLNTVEVHVGRLRRKIGRDAIVTVRGLGYRFAQ